MFRQLEAMSARDRRIRITVTDVRDLLELDGQNIS